MLFTKKNLVVLTNVSGNHSKFYAVWIEKKRDNFVYAETEFVVKFAYGKIGNKPIISEKNTFYYASEAISQANRLIQEKIRGGYEKDDTWNTKGELYKAIGPYQDFVDFQKSERKMTEAEKVEILTKALRDINWNNDVYHDGENIAVNALDTVRRGVVEE